VDTVVGIVTLSRSCGDSAVTGDGIVPLGDVGVVDGVDFSFDWDDPMLLYYWRRDRGLLCVIGDGASSEKQ